MDGATWGAGSALEDDGPTIDATGGGGSTQLEPTLIDVIGRSLVGRYYGVVYDPTSAHEPAPLDRIDDSDDVVIDLRTQPPRRSRSVRARWRAFRAYWRGDLLSMIGDNFTLVALPIAADRMTRSGFDVGVVVSVETLATVLFGTMAGTFTDRRLPRPTMMTADLCRMVILSVLVVLDRTSHSTFGALVVAAFLLGVLRLLSDGARSAFVADLVPDELDVRSNNRLVLAENVGTTVGPLLAGVVITGGLWRAFGIDAVSFACSAAAIVVAGRMIRRHGITEHAPAQGDADLGSYLADSRAAIRAILDDVVFRRALVVVTVFNLVTLPLGPQFVTIAVRTLHLGYPTIGALFAVGGVAGILAAPLVERDSAIRPGVLPVSTGVAGAAVLVVGLRPSVVTVTVAFVVGGACFAFLLTHWAALRQRRFTVELQGRITLTARRVMFSSILLGSLAGGWLSDAAHPPALWVAAGSAGLLAAGWGLAVGLHHERYD